MFFRKDSPAGPRDLKRYFTDQHSIMLPAMNNCPSLEISYFRKIVDCILIIH